MTQDIEVRQNPEPVSVFKNQVLKNEHEFRAALPSHISVERFTRVVMTAAVNNPSLLEADRRSLFESAIKAAQDGLLPDGREGALVIFNAKGKGADGRDRWIKKVQWMPMIGGILKKVRNSGELLSIAAHVVYANDDFSYELGDDERITHIPALDNRGVPRLLYAIAKLKDGGIYREIMTIADIEKVRSVSRSGNDGPWVVWFDEMARKTVIRRLCKRLPMSSDLDELIRRDDANYDVEGVRDTAPLPHPRTLKSRLEALAVTGGSGDNSALEDMRGEHPTHHDPETGEVISAEMARDAQAAADAMNDPTGEKAGVELAKRLEERAKTPIDLGLQRLINDGRAVAQKGSAQFKIWHRRLSQQHSDMIEPHLGQLRSESEAVDAAKGA